MSMAIDASVGTLAIPAPTAIQHLGHWTTFATDGLGPTGSCNRKGEALSNVFRARD